MKNSITYFFTIVFLLSTPLFAEGKTITLEEARTLALANSRTLAKYNLAVQSALLDEKAQSYSAFPSPSLGLNAGVSLWSAEDGPSPNPLDTFSAGASIGLSQKIFEGGKQPLLKAINAMTTEMNRMDALAEYFNVLDAADNAYYAALEASATLAAEEDALETATLALSIAEVRQAGGMTNQGDYLKALADKEARENARNQARRNLALCAAKLKSLTGLGENPVPEQIDFGGYEEAILRLGTISDEEADSLYGKLLGSVAAENPSLASARLSDRRAEKNVSLAKRSYAPSLSASFSTGIEYSRTGGLEASAGRLSISGNIPLDFWVTANNVKKSSIARETAALDYLNSNLSLETELQTVLIDAIGQAGSVLSSRRALEYAEKHFEYIAEGYRLSRNSVSELSDASALVSSARGQFIKARYGFLRSLSALRSLGAFADEEKLLYMMR